MLNVVVVIVVAEVNIIDSFAPMSSLEMAPHALNFKALPGRRSAGVVYEFALPSSSKKDQHEREDSTFERG